jgi:hypothetical protein
MLLSFRPYSRGGGLGPDFAGKLGVFAEQAERRELFQHDPEQDGTVDPLHGEPSFKFSQAHQFNTSMFVVCCESAVHLGLDARASD